MSIFQHRYSACANELATTCYSMSPVHKYCTNIAQILQDCTNKQHGTTEQHGTHWATKKQLSNKREVWNMHGSPGHGVCVHMLCQAITGYHFHKLQAKVCQKMVSDWGQPFWRGSKMYLKIQLLPIFADIYTFSQKQVFASTSTAIFSVICCDSQLLSTIFIKFIQKSFIIWFKIGSNFFGSGYNLHLKKQFLPILVCWQKLEKLFFFKTQFVTTYKEV